MKNLVNNRLTNGEKPVLGVDVEANRGICGKVVYANKEDAEAYIRGSGKDYLNVYYCILCFGYHLTSNQ